MIIRSFLSLIVIALISEPQIDLNLDRNHVFDHSPSATTTTDNSHDEVPAHNDVRIDAVYLAQTHVMKPDQPYFKLVGNRDALLKVQVISPSGAPAPAVTVTVINGNDKQTIKLIGPAVLPKSFNSNPGQVQHRFEDSFTTMIPASIVKYGMSIEIHAGSNVVKQSINVGAPTVVHMKIFGVHYFGKDGEDFPNPIFKEIEAKWPVSLLEVERIRGINFPELIIPTRDHLPAVRVSSKDEYLTKTGKKFDGEQAAALQWVSALSRSGGNEDVALCLINILGVAAGGQANNFNGVSGPGLGVLHHELGHALGLQHNSNNKEYPYHGEMFGVKPPDIFKELHAGPTWAFDLPSRTFIPATVQDSGVSGRNKVTIGTYKADPMQGGGTGDQEPPFMLRHFSDYNVHKMQAYLEKHVAIRRDNNYFKWDDNIGEYSIPMDCNGVNYPVAEDVQVISVMAAMTMTNLDLNMIYTPIGPYRGNLIKTFDPRQTEDRQASTNAFSRKDGCDFTFRIIQGDKERYYLLPASDAHGKIAQDQNAFVTAAVNVPAKDGNITLVELLSTPKADKVGLPKNPQVLAHWHKD